MRLIAITFVFAVLLAAESQARVLDVPAAHESVRLLDASLSAPVQILGAMDDGGGAPKVMVKYNRDRFLSILLAIIPGFGLGHFWANDTNGFVTFLIVDLAIWGGTLVWNGFGWPLGGIMWVVVVLAKVWQVYDVVRVTGGAGGDGPDLLRRRIAALPATERGSPHAAVASPAFSIAF